ncbi:MAG: hypothetical protein ACR2MT_02675 [Aurantibacter sp.]
MKRKTEKIIAIFSSFIFLYLGLYLSIIAHGEITTGTNIQHFVSTGIVLAGVLGITLFSIIITINYFRSTSLINKGDPF